MSTLNSKKDGAPHFSHSHDGFEAVMNRLLEAAGRSGSPGSYAELLDINPNTVRTWRSRDRVPIAALEEAAKKYGASLDYLREGIGALRITTDPAPTAREAARPYRAGQRAPTEWRQIVAALIDLDAPRTKGWSGARTLEVADLLYDMERRGVALNQDVVATVIASLT